MGIYGKHGRATAILACPLKRSSPAGASQGPGDAWGASSALLSEDCLRHSAVEAVRQQQYPWALVLLNQLIERHPHRAAYHSNRGLVQMWCGQYAAALEDFNRALALDPSLDQGYNNRATCHAALGQPYNALFDYDRALALNPFNTRARLNLGITLRDIGHLDDALTCLDEALLFYQLTEHLYAERGRTYHQLGDWNCALADYRRCLDALAQLDPTPTHQRMAQRVQGWIDELLSGCR